VSKHIDALALYVVVLMITGCAGNTASRDILHDAVAVYEVFGTSDPSTYSDAPIAGDVPAGGRTGMILGRSYRKLAQELEKVVKKHPEALPAMKYDVEALANLCHVISRKLERLAKNPSPAKDADATEREELVAMTYALQAWMRLLTESGQAYPVDED
jgi:hypothetical protein